ncbi:unnamed protein product [Angiostrongylus costaricensis]|uniref:PB1 domain-containing protein n=1 Tax=Angiostrongylus costaricensis TaxID=334426 RepID=A0A0R3PK04_ANGCS|nr:unnamed protein product [Angiostrongylus costaricensis]
MAGPEYPAGSVRVEFFREDRCTFIHQTPDELYRLFMIKVNRIGGPNAVAYYTNRERIEVRIDDAETLDRFTEGRAVVRITVHARSGGSSPHSNGGVSGRRRNSADRDALRRRHHHNGRSTATEERPCVFCGHVRRIDSQDPPSMRPRSAQYQASDEASRRRVRWRFIPVPYVEYVNESNPPNADR